LGSFTAHNLNLKKILQVSIDGPSVNLKFLSELKGFLKNGEDPQEPELPVLSILFMVHSRLHMMHVGGICLIFCVLPSFQGLFKGVLFHFQQVVCRSTVLLCSQIG